MLGYKRERSVSEDSENTQQSHDAELEWGAEVLRALKHARWQPAHLQTIVSASEEDSSVCSADCSPTASATGSPIAVSPEELVAGDQSTSSCDSAVTAVPKAAQAHRAVTSAPRVAAPTRSYVWRNPSRRPTEQPAGQDAGSASDEETEPADSPSGSGKSDRDKEWAALTTWLRMNLHQPRTAKRVVLFVGVYLPAERRWTFMLNPALIWDDVSPETKLRLRTLPEETAAAFGRKYPGKVSRDWLKKTQKYRPPGSNHTVSVPLGDMVYSMAEIYAKYESAAAPSTSAPAGAATAATATATTSAKTSGGSPASPASFAAAAATAPGQGAPAVPPSMPSSASVASAALAPMPSAQLPPPPSPLPPTTSIQQQQPFPLGPPKQQQKQQAKQQRAAAAAAVAAAQLLQQQHPHPHALPAAQLMASRLAAMPALAAAAAAAMGGPIGGPGGMAAPSPFLASALSMPLEQIMAYY